MKIIEKLKRKIEKYKKNEITYRKAVEEMKRVIKTKEKQLLSFYTMINGVVVIP